MTCIIWPTPVFLLGVLFFSQWCWGPYALPAIELEPPACKACIKSIMFPIVLTVVSYIQCGTLNEIADSALDIDCFPIKRGLYSIQSVHMVLMTMHKAI